MKFILYVTILSSMLIACAKKDTAPEATPAPSNNNPITYYAYGSMGAIDYQFYNLNSFAGNDSAVSAVFYSDPQNPTTSLVDAGAITFNGNALINNSNSYSAYSLNIHQANSIWAVAGNSVVPTINYTMTPNYPIFSGNTQLPDSFSITQPLTFNISGISNHSNSSIFVQIHDNMNSVYKLLNVNQTTCSFTASELSVLQPSNNAYIIINLANTVLQTFDGKSYGFTSTLNHTKSGVLIKP